MAGRDVTKFDAVLTRRCYEIFTHMTYLSDYIATENLKNKFRV